MPAAENGLSPPSTISDSLFPGTGSHVVSLILGMFEIV